MIFEFFYEFSVGGKLHPKTMVGPYFVGKIIGFHIRNFGVFGDGAFFTLKIGKSETGRFGVLGRGRLKHYENRV